MILGSHTISKHRGYPNGYLKYSTYKMECKLQIDKALQQKKDAFEYNRLGIVLTILFLYQNTEEKSCMEKQKKI